MITLEMAVTGDIGKLSRREVTLMLIRPGVPKEIHTSIPGHLSCRSVRRESF